MQGLCAALAHPMMNSRVLYLTLAPGISIFDAFFDALSAQITTLLYGPVPRSSCWTAIIDTSGQE